MRPRIQKPVCKTRIISTELEPKFKFLSSKNIVHSMKRVGITKHNQFESSINHILLIT